MTFDARTLGAIPADDAVAETNNQPFDARSFGAIPAASQSQLEAPASRPVAGGLVSSGDALSKALDRANKKRDAVAPPVSGGDYGDRLAATLKGALEPVSGAVGSIYGKGAGDSVQGAISTVADIGVEAPGFVKDAAVGIASSPADSATAFVNHFQNASGSLVEGLGSLARQGKVEYAKAMAAKLRSPEMLQYMAERNPGLDTEKLSREIEAAINSDETKRAFDEPNFVELAGRSAKDSAATGLKSLPDEFRDAPANQALQGLASSGVILGSAPFRGASLVASASMMADEQRQDYLRAMKDKGEEPTQEGERNALLAGAALAPTEYIPIRRILKRAKALNGAPSSKAAEKALDTFSGRAKQYGVDVAQSGLEEGFTEFLQGLGSNVIAKDLLSYDEAREYLGDVDQQTYAGMSAGALMSALLGIPGLSGRKGKTVAGNDLGKSFESASAEDAGVQSALDEELSDVGLQGAAAVQKPEAEQVLAEDEVRGPDSNGPKTVSQIMSEHGVSPVSVAAENRKAAREKKNKPYQEMKTSLAKEYSSAGDKKDTVDAERDDILTAIAKLGGLDPSSLGGEVDVKTAGSMSRVGRPVVRAKGKGKTMDHMAESLNQLGYMAADGAILDPNSLTDLVDSATRGDMIYSVSSAREGMIDPDGDIAKTWFRGRRESVLNAVQKFIDGGTLTPNQQGAVDDITNVLRGSDGSIYRDREIEQGAGMDIMQGEIPAWFGELQNLDPDGADSAMRSAALSSIARDYDAGAIDENDIAEHAEAIMSWSANDYSDKATGQSAGKIEPAIIDMVARAIRSGATDAQIAEVTAGNYTEMAGGLMALIDPSGGKDAERRESLAEVDWRYERETGANPAGFNDGESAPASAYEGDGDARAADSATNTGGEANQQGNARGNSDAKSKAAANSAPLKQDDSDRRDNDRRATGENVHEKYLRGEELTPEEAIRLATMSEIAPLPNKRAFLRNWLEHGRRKSNDASYQMPVIVSIDADSLKWVNDNLSHDDGDAMLMSIGEALRLTGSDAYHLSGDEFAIVAPSEKAGREAVAEAQKILSTKVIKATHKDGSEVQIKGFTLTSGVGATLKDADNAMQAEKSDKEKKGERATRGEKPEWIVLSGGESGNQKVPGQSERADAESPRGEAEVRRGSNSGRPDGDRSAQVDGLPQSKTIDNESPADVGLSGSDSEVMSVDEAVQHRIEVAKTEIARDIKNGTIPHSVRSFSDLHDYVDANEYVSDADRADRVFGAAGKAAGFKPADFAKHTNRIIDAVDSWLRDGRDNNGADLFGKTEEEQAKQKLTDADAAKNKKRSAQAEKAAKMSDGPLFDGSQQQQDIADVTAKPKKKKKPVALTKTQARSIEVMGGAVVGDTVVLSKDAGYLLAGQEYLIDEISKTGAVYFKRADRDSGTYLSGGEMARAGRDGVKFAKPVTKDASIDAAANEAATSPENETADPTDAQIEAGNYKKGHASVHGIDISIENPRGSKRSGTDPDGNKWEQELAHHYGYVKGTKGADGEHVDVFVGKDIESPRVFVIDQANPDGSFDEHKVMLGFKNKLQARRGYLGSYEKGWKVGPVTEMTVDEFKSWLADGDTTNPAAQNSSGDVSHPKTIDELEKLPKYSVYTNGKKFMVRGDGKRGGGDSIFGTAGEAIKGAESERARDKANEEYRQGNESKAAAKEAADAAKKDSEIASYQGFLSESPMIRQRQLDVLRKKFLYNGKASSRKEIIDSIISDGGSVQTIESNDDSATRKAKAELSSKKMINAPANENHPDAIRKKELKAIVENGSVASKERALYSPVSDSYRTEADITKIGMDYAEHVLGLADGDTAAPIDAGKGKPTSDGKPSNEERIGKEIDALIVAAKKRYKEETRQSMPDSELNFFDIATKDEAARRHDLVMQLPSEGQKRIEARERLLDRAASRRNKSEKKDASSSKPGNKSEPKEKIDDFGETLHGARKHNAEKLSFALRDESVNVASEPLAKSFPAPNYKKLSEEGVPAENLALVALLRDSIPSKPRVRYKLMGWSGQVESAREMAGELINGGVEAAQNIKHELDKARFKRDLIDTAKAIKDIDPSLLPQAAKYRVESANYSMIGGKIVDGNQSFWSLRGPNGRTVRGIFTKHNSYDKDYVDNKDYAISSAAEAISKELSKEGGPAKQKSKYTDVGIYQNRRTGEVFLAFKVRSSKIRLKSGFENAKSAREYLDENRDSIQEKINSMRAGPTMRGMDNSPRTGKSFRDGDVSPEEFSSVFGFRGVQFGNYVEGARRQADLNHSYDALMDLSDALGIPPKAISLNGSLGLAFGARGTGGKRPAKAHYERGTVVINLTKNNGPGSLAHEWLHALDNYFSIQDGSEGYISEKSRSSGKVRDEVYRAWKAVEKSIKAGGFSERSAEHDLTRSKPYWNTTIEKAARSFERYIFDRLDEKGVSNDYLVNINKDGGAYPTQEEMIGEGIRDAYDRLFDTIETKETDKGVMLFSESGKTTQKKSGLSVSAVQQSVRKAVGNVRHRKIKVVQSMADLPAKLRGKLSVAPDQTDTPEFKAWFGDSKVVDAEGRPLVVYHGGTASGSFSGPSFFAQEKEGAGWYAEDRGGHVSEAYLSIKRPFILENGADAKSLASILNDYGIAATFVDSGGGWDFSVPSVADHSGYEGSNPFDVVYIPDAVAALESAGYDGMAGLDTLESGDVYAYVAFRPEQIKPAAGNNGNFDPASDSILESRSAKSDTDSKEFKEWFGDSKLVDADGTPMRVYHGTRTAFDNLTSNWALGWGEGIYLTDNKQQAAEEYGFEGRLIEAYVSLQNPYTGQRVDIESTQAWADVRGEWDEDAEEWVGGEWAESQDAFDNDGGFADRVLRELGFDGVMMKGSNNIDGFEIVAFEDDQVRIARSGPSPNILNQSKIEQQTETPDFTADMAVLAAIDSEQNSYTGEDLNVPLALEESREAKVSELAGKMLAGGNYTGGFLPTGSGFISATPSSKDAGMWQVTSFSKDWQPLSDTGLKSAQEAVEEMLTEGRPLPSGSTLDQTKTPGFKRWFGESKVVDDAGKPLVVYHGTGSDFDTFSDEFYGEATGEGDHGGGFYFTESADVASDFAGSDSPSIMPVYLRLKNPATNEVMVSDEVQAALDDDMGFVEVQDVLTGMGYDGIIYDHGEKGGKEYVVFDSKQIKSAIGNNGSFDPINPDIRMSGDSSSRAEGVFDPETGDVYLIADNIASPDRAAWVAWHELWHRGARVKNGNELDAILKSARVNKTVRRLADAIIRDRSMKDGPKTGLIATEEAMAELAAASASGDFKSLSDRYGVDIPSGLNNGWRGALARFLDRAKKLIGSIVGRKSDGMSDAEVFDFVRSGLDVSGSDYQTGEKGSQLNSVAADSVSTETDDNQVDDIRRDIESNHADAEDTRSMKQRAKDYFSAAIGKDWEAIGNELRWGMLDTFDPIKQLEVKAAGGLLDGSDSAYKAALRTKNLDSVMAAVLHKGPLKINNGGFELRGDGKGFLEIFEDIATRDELQLWEHWAGAIRARRLMREGRENLYTNEQINRILNFVDGNPEMKARFERAHKDWRAFNRASLDMAEQAGVISPDERRVWQSDDYVPFHRVQEAAEEVINAPRGKKGIEGQSSGVKKLKGGTGKISIVESMLMNTQHLVDASFKNLAMQRVVDMAEPLGAMEKLGPEYKPVYVDVRQMAKVLEAAGVDVSGLSSEEKGRWETVFTRVAPSDPNVVSVMREGKREYYRVEDPLLIKSISAMGADSLGTVVKILGVPKKFLTAAVTADPGFMLRNFLRDSLSTWVTVHPENVPGFKKKPLLDAVKGVKKSLENNDSQWAIMAAGAGGGGFYESVPSDVRKQMKAIDPTSVLDSPGKLWRAWKKFGQAFENANRIAVYDSVIEAGGSASEAANEAQDIMNFTMSGGFPAVKFLIQTVPFMNARVQGLYRLYRGAKEDPRSFFLKGASLMAASMALLASNWDDDRYWDLPAWDRDVYWHFWVGDNHFRLPKPFEVGAIFATIPELMAGYARDGDEGLLADRLLHMFSDTFAMNPVPQAIKPLGEAYFNYSTFRGRSIVPEHVERYVQPEAQYDPWTSETMKAVAKAMPDFAPDSLRSPKKLEHLMRSYAGTLGAYALSASDGVARAVNDSPSRPSAVPAEIPVISSFYRKGERNTKYPEMVYDMVQEANQIAGTIKKYRDENMRKEASELELENRNKLSARTTLNKVTRRFSAISGQVKDIMDSRSMTPVQKRAELEELYAERNELAKEIANKYQSTFQ